MRETHLITGATGFVGSAIVLELLRTTRHDVVALVRPGPDGDAGARLRQALVRVAELYGATELLDELGRCRVVAGDLTADGCGADGFAGPVAQVWHAAASLQFEDRHQEAIRAVNVDGTRRALALAERLGAGAFNYVSTAYVAGRTSGEIAEERLPAAVPQNHYERSKIDAEALVAASPLCARLLRPSIVVGHSETHATTSASGYYGFVRQLVQFRGIVERTQKGLLERTPLRFCLEAEVDLNIVTVDAVAREAVGVAESASAQGVYHLTHPRPSTVGEVVLGVCRLLELPAPSFVRDAGELSWLDEQLDRRLVFYGSYLHGDKRFARTRTDAALGRPAEHSPVSLEPFGRWYLDVLERARVNLPAVR